VLAVLTKAFDRKRLATVLLIVKPETVIGWHLASPPDDGPTPAR